jgi:CheY-like chemotaxis protein
MPIIKPLILVVDDTPIASLGTACVLQTLGFMADQAGSGREALVRVGASQYALIFMDHDMPDMDGFECTQKIREMENGTGTRIPIVGLTASDETDIREKCLQAGMDDYLHKRYTPEELRQILSKWVIELSQPSVI